MANTITGRVYRIEPTRTFNTKNGQRTFQRRTLVLDATTYNPMTGERGIDNYPSIEFGGDKCSLLDGLHEGDIVEVSYALEGSRYNDRQTGEERFFTRARGFAVTARGAQGTQGTQAPAQPTPAAPPMPQASVPQAPAQPAMEFDDLPF